VVESSLKDAYEVLKAVIRRRWGDASPVARAVDALEGDPSSKDHAGALEQKIADVRAREDPEVMKALAKLVASLERAGIGGSAIAQVNLNVQGGNLQGVIGAQHVTIATLSFGAQPNNTKADRRVKNEPAGAGMANTSIRTKIGGGSPQGPDGAN
jgi:hypothetical protein